MLVPLWRTGFNSVHSVNSWYIFCQFMQVCLGHRKRYQRQNSCMMCWQTLRPPEFSGLQHAKVYQNYVTSLGIYGVIFASQRYLPFYLDRRIEHLIRCWPLIFILPEGFHSGIMCVKNWPSPFILLLYSFLNQAAH